MSAKTPSATSASEARKVQVHILDLTARIEQSPQSSALFYQRARAFAADGRTRDAIKDLNRALKIAPDDAEARLAKAQVLVGEGQYLDAIEHMKRLISNHETLSVDTANLLAMV